MNEPRNQGGGCGPGAVWVDDSRELSGLLESVGSGPLAVDSEADSFHRYRERVCLLQLSFGASNLLVDPLAGTDLSLLGPLFHDRGLRKILHGADYDIRLLHRDCGLTIEGLFDTMVAARLVGERSFGLSDLLARYLGVQLDKRFQRADWAVRPLSEEMTRYAVLDTCHLIELSAILEAKLDELGRSEWAAEEFQRLEQVRWEGGRQNEEPWLRVKGIRELDPRSLAVLRELAQIRDEAARQLDRPLFRVVRDEALVGLASCATSGGRLSDVRGVPRAWLRGVQREALESAFERGRQRAERDAPVLPTRPRGPRRSREHEARLRRVRRERDRIAEQLDLEPSMLASRAVLERVLSCLDEGDSLEQVADLRRWQRAQLGPVFDVARG